jgi:hypothetical protein
MEVGGHALCTFHRIGACAVAGPGRVYEPARKARTLARTARAIADRTEIRLIIVPSAVRGRGSLKVARV